MTVIDFFEKHKGVRRILLLWTYLLITYGTVEVFSEGTSLTGFQVTVFGTLVGLASVATGFYINGRKVSVNLQKD